MPHVYVPCCSTQFSVLNDLQLLVFNKQNLWTFVVTREEFILRPFWVFQDKGPDHIETSPLIYSACRDLYDRDLRHKRV